jgi:hypothetical protein
MTDWLNSRYRRDFLAPVGETVRDANTSGRSQMANVIDTMLSTEAGATELMRLIIASYLLAHMMDTDAHAKNGESPKERKVRAAFEYADLLMKG